MLRDMLMQNILNAPTVRHKKRQSTYLRAFEDVEVQTSRPIVEGDKLTIYIGESGKVWARLDEEFNDGRFEVVS